MFENLSHKFTTTTQLIPFQFDLRLITSIADSSQAQNKVNTDMKI